MRQWEKWECQAVTGAFPNLQWLCIEECPKLKGQLPWPLVPLKTLYIGECQQLEASTPRALHLELQDYGKLELNWATMKTLQMSGHIISDTSLEHLFIHSYDSDDSVSLLTFPLDSFPALRTLDLSKLRNLQMISQNHAHYHHLETLRIGECPKFESLPENMHMLLPSLKELHLEDCPRLESFPNGGLPSNLIHMKLSNCSRLDAESFPDEGLLPLSLTSLFINDISNLKNLDYKGLFQLSSLTTLAIVDCPNLQRIPEEGLPRSISDFQIARCPLLQQRCQREVGEDWEKISHIQNLTIR